MTAELERRRARRFALSLPVRIPNPAPGPVFGVTKDVSSAGLYIYTESPEWQEGGRIQFVFDFPVEVTGHAATTLCGGTVVRAEHVESLRGIAVRIDRISFLDRQ
jgi:hypothetical protein